MGKWLSDAEIDLIEEYGPGSVWIQYEWKRLCTQAREANRLRAGLEHLECLFARDSEVVEAIRKLLED